MTENRLERIIEKCITVAGAVLAGSGMGAIYGAITKNDYIIANSVKTVIATGIITMMVTLPICYLDYKLKDKREIR